MRASLSPYLRSLWNVTPALLDITEPHHTRPFLSPLGLHLPLHAPAHEAPDPWFQAAAAHAAAHLVFSQHRFDPAGLRPVTQAILGALEDARVEWLASRELPGLRRLWLPFHAAVMSDTPSFEDLLRRLARSLLDLAHHDPHPWVIKARQLFFVDDAGDMLALRQPAALRHAASLLGNDIGQMRLQFNARLYAVMPSYRDDNSCLWLADKLCADTEHEITTTPPAGPAATILQRHCYPEWDRLVPMYRRDWCSVLDNTVTVPASPRPAARRTRQMAQPEGDGFDLHSRLSTRLGAALRHATRLISSRDGALRRVLLLTDGKPHDVDVHDPHYLVEDARQAVREAARRGVLMQCVSLEAAAWKLTEDPRHGPLALNVIQRAKIVPPREVHDGLV